MVKLWTEVDSDTLPLYQLPEQSTFCKHTPIKDSHKAQHNWGIRKEKEIEMGKQEIYKGSKVSYMTQLHIERL
jgi:hypothetical protein